MSGTALLTAVEFTTPALVEDVELFTGLGFLARAAAGAQGVELRTCADPYGCRIVLRSGPGVGLGHLTWRLPGADHLDAAVRAVRGRGTVADLVRDAGWAGDGFRVEHPDGSATVLHWQQDREWAAGPALSCPLHPDGSTQLCDPAPPLVEGVVVPARARDLARWAADVLGRTDGVAAVAGEGPGLRLRSSLVRSPAVTTTPGGLELRLAPDRAGATLESEHAF